MGTMELISWIQTIVTAGATLAVALATIHYTRILKENARKTSDRPRKEDEINSIIVPLISTCNGEITQLSNKWYTFLKFDLFSENIQKNDYKEMVFKEFIKGKDELKTAINDHEQIIRALRKNHQELIGTINTDSFRLKVKKILEEHNKKYPKLMLNQEINSLSKTITYRIIEKFDLNIERFHDPLEKIWETNRKSFLQIRKQKNVQKYLKEIEKLSNKLIEKNSFIINNLTKIINEYTKEYGISLSDKLNDLSYL